MRRDERPHLQASREGVIDRTLLFGARGAQHEIERLLGAGDVIAGVADADAQPPEVLRAEHVRRIPQAVVPRQPAAELQARGPRREIELVMAHENLIGRDPIEPRDGADRLAGVVHERPRLEQPDVTPCNARHFPLERGLAPERRGDVARDGVHKPEAGVMARAFVFPAWIAEPDDELHACFEEWREK
jgi:hypothetical protein